MDYYTWGTRTRVPVPCGYPGTQDGGRTICIYIIRLDILPKLTSVSGPWRQPCDQ